MILHIIEYLYVGPHANRQAIFDFMQININIIYCSRAQNDIERGLYEHERNTACTHVHIEFDLHTRAEIVISYTRHKYVTRIRSNS